MLTKQQIRVQRAVLQALADVPEGYLLTDAILRAEASRMCITPPITTELDAEIRRADETRRIIGLPTDEGTKWKITDAGRLWLAEHP